MAAAKLVKSSALHDSQPTPVMRQYAEQKRQAGDAVLLFRMGDFYETFYEDAKTVSKVLGIALTSRNKGDDNPIPLAGIPYHALEGYLKKLVVAGLKVAISEQVEDPKLAKGVVKRQIVRVVTAGTLTDEALLDERSENVLAALCDAKRAVGVAVVELSTGRFQALTAEGQTALDQLVRLGPAELLIDEEAAAGSPAVRMANELRAIGGSTLTRRPAFEFVAYNAEQALKDHFDVATLAGFGFEPDDPCLRAAGAILGYLRETQKTALGHLSRIEPLTLAEHLQIDHSSWRSLELERTLRGGTREGSLLGAIDRTVHPIGARQLRRWLGTPSRRAAEIVARQQAIAGLVDDQATRRQVRQTLKGLADLERIAGRVAMARAIPRDLAGLAIALNRLPQLANHLQNAQAPRLVEVVGDLSGLEDLAELLGRAVREDAPMTIREGGIIKPGFDAELDRLEAIGRDGQSWLARYQQTQIEQTGINNLKVGFNRVFGYYLEVPHSQQQRVPAGYVRKQTVKNAERYITDELKRFENEALTAQEKSYDRHAQLFEQLRRQVADQTDALLRVARAIGQLDALAGLAELAVQRRYVRPQLIDEPRVEITGGRHPVLEQSLADGFVPNDCHLDQDQARLFIITGPNMAGKSTYIRQVALLTLLAQIGSFVPAERMTFAPVDRIFARVGASDEISRGQSTFMVEMTEAANILNNATPRSLVVLDELGRGTSTFDGLALAWAVTEHLANQTRCLTLMATHYHELTELADLLQGVRNYNVAVQEVAGAAAEAAGESIVFLHRIVPGGTDKSYGLHVAKLAGVPAVVIQRGRQVLAELERGFSRESQSGSMAQARTKVEDQLLLFDDPAEQVAKALSELDLDQLTPIEALNKLKALKDQLAGG